MENLTAFIVTQPEDLTDGVFAITASHDSIPVL